jgi:hypothetical protein
MRNRVSLLYWLSRLAEPSGRIWPEGVMSDRTRKVIHDAFCFTILISVLLLLFTLKVLNHCVSMDPRILRSSAYTVQAELYVSIPSSYWQTQSEFMI